MRLSASLAAIAALIALPAAAAPLTPAQTQAIDASVGEWLAQTGAPSVSIAVVSGGQLAYAKAYGKARLPGQAATTATRYAIDSVSKEFTAAALLKLQEEGKLSLDDKVGKYFPDLTAADRVTIRQILSHTAGYRDYWPQDYVTLEMQKPVTPAALMDEWAKKPLDYEPGAKWQYSNTGFVVAGAIAEKAAGQPLMAFLDANVFRPLGMADVFDADQAPLPAADAGGYTRWGGGPVRPAEKEGKGWLYAAGELAMTPSTLARWDISLMDRSLLKPASYDVFYTSVKLANGDSANYSAGLSVHDDHGRLKLEHGGGGSGFLSQNALWPAEKIAVIAMTNNDWAGPGDVVDRVAFVVLPPTAIEARVRRVFADFQAGTIDRALFTANGNGYLSAQVLADQKAGLAPLGAPRRFELTAERRRGGLDIRIWRVTTAKGVLTVREMAEPDGKIEQFTVAKGG